MISIVLTVILTLLVIYLFIINKRLKNNQYESVRFSSQPIFVTDNIGKIIFVNDIALDLVNQPLSYLRSVSIFELIDGLPECLLNNISCQEVHSDDVCVCNKMAPEKKEFALIHKSKATIPVKIRALRQKNGNFIYYLQELSIQKNLERQLESQNKVATFGEFLAGVLHEVGNPMSAIEGIAADLIWQLENNRENNSIDYMKEQLNIIQNQANRVNQVKNEFSLISADTSALAEQVQLIDIKTLLRQLVDLVHFDKRSQTITMNLALSNNLPAINTNAGKLTQILLNVFSNAIDALQAQSHACIDITAVTEKNTVKVTICDNGPGIEQELLEKVFEPFYTTKSQGTGLGLMICKRLADSLAIDFKITSTVEKNTQVELIFPIDNN